MTLNTAGTYTVAVQNGSGGATSNGLSLTIGAAAVTLTAYSTTPSSPAAGQQFTINLSGNNFNPSTARILFTGPGCSPCTVPNSVLSTKSSTLLIGPATLNTAGSYTVAVQNGSGGATSNGLSLTVGGMTPSLSSLSTSPSPPVVGQQFTLTINGSNFDPGTAQILVFGTSCGPCTVPNGVLTTKTATRIAGPVTLNTSGSFDIRVQNGPGGGQSNALTLTVGTATPSLTAYSTTPSSPVAGQQFTINLSGNNFNPSTARILVTGPGCSPCTVPNSVLSTKSSTLLIGPVTLNTAGTYTVAVQNGSGATLSNSLGLTINSATGTPSGTLNASPSTCQVIPPKTTCTISLSWSTKNAGAAQIWVTDALGADKPVTAGLSGTYTATWIEALPQKYVFHLWDYSSGNRGAELASVAVAATKSSAGQTDFRISVQPSQGPPGTTFTFLGSGAPAAQVQLRLRRPGTGEAFVLLTSVGAGTDGSFNYRFSTQTNTQSGRYEVFATVDLGGTNSNTAVFSVQEVPPDTTNGLNNGNNATSNDPINTATGNYVYQRTDLTLPARGLPLAFTRAYNSQDGTPGPMGAGWMHSYMASLTVSQADGSVTIHMLDGRLVVYDNQDGVYVSRYDNVYSTLESPSPGIFLLTTKSLVAYRFDNGRLTAVSDRNGNTIQLAYSGNLLATITDTVGRRITLGYDGSGHITSLTDPTGRTLRYEYDAAGNLTGFTDARGGRFSYTYDAAYRMLTATDSEGNRFLTNVYDSAGKAVSQSDGESNRWTYAYDTDADTLITTITDPKGRVSSHVHDRKYQVLRITDSLGKSEEYEYNDLGNRTTVKDRNGNITRFSYDLSGNVIAAFDARSKIRAASYNAHNDPLSGTDPLGNMITFAYDARGNLTSSRDPLGNETSFAYDSYGQLVSKTDAEGRTTRYAYDSAGNLVEEVDALGNRTRHAYDEIGRRTSTTDANGFTTAFAYDPNDNLVSVTDPLGDVVRYAYDGNNNRIQVTDQRGNSTKFRYDGNYQLVATVNARDNATTRAYDELRNLASVTDPLGNTIRYGYDSENRLVSTTDPSGGTTRYEYDARGNRTRVIDAPGNATTFVYDPLNRLISARNALGHETRTEYDDAGRIVRRIDEAGNATSYEYDAVGRQVKMTDALGGEVSFQYDRVGNRTRITDTRGKVTQFTYDGLNRPLTITDPLGNVTRNRYDAVGNLAQLTDGNGNAKSYEYDGNRRLRKVGYSTGGAVQYEYDAVGNRIRMLDLIGESTYAYDNLNRLETYRSPAGATLGLEWDAASNRVAIRYPGDRLVTYTYDPNGRISSVQDWNGFEADYTYDAAGRIAGARFSNGLTSQYAYDAVGQNVGIEHRNATGVIYSETTTWSPNGNPTSSDISGLNSPGLPSETSPYTYDDANQLTTWTYGTPVHDKNGNLVVMPGFGGPTTFSYDLNNRATGISGPEVSATMRYYGDGKLAELSLPNAPQRFLLDPISASNRILGDLDTTGGIQAGYVYGPAGLALKITSGQTYTYLHNLQGSVVALLDGAGFIRNSYRYDPFGKQLSVSTQQVADSFAFLGSSSVPSISQYSLTSYRVYDARLGRFYGTDPLRFDIDLSSSPFVYARQSPVRSIDPSGLAAQQVLSLSSDVSTIAAELLKRNILVVNPTTGMFDVVKDLPTDLKAIGSVDAALSSIVLALNFYQEATSGTNSDLALAHAFSGLSVDALSMIYGPLSAVLATWSISTTVGGAIGSHLGGAVIGAADLIGQGDNFTQWSSEPSWVDDVTVEKLNPLYWAKRGVNGLLNRVVGQ